MPHPFQQNASARPRPAPLVKGEHVLCTIRENSRHPPVDAIVVELDNAYILAAKAFMQTERQADHQPSLDPDDGFMLATSLSNSQPAENREEDDQSAEYSLYIPPGPSYPTIPDQETVDLTNDAIDLDADADPQFEPSEIMFREEGKSTTTPAPKRLQHKLPFSPQGTPNSSRYKRRREVGLPPGIEVYAANGHIKPSDMPAPHPITTGRVYVHFSGKDRRLDRWVNANELERASASMVAAAASGVVENTLVDNAAQADFVVADTQLPARKLTRSRRREYEAINPVSEKETGNEVAARMERAREEKTKVRNISAIVIGDYHVDAWYYSSYPGPYGLVHTLYICKFCLKYVRTRRRYTKHCSTCTWRRPPGAVIYHDTHNDLRVYEVDGFVNTVYCQRLCLLAKLFLDHKTLYYDVAPFLFYLVTLGDELAGFFSKENPIICSENNLACILTLPQHQRKGVGGFLISLSYELSKIEQKIGSPERPLSDLGQLSYRSYWAYSVVRFLRSREGMAGITTKEISEATAIQITDVVSTLKDLNLIHIWKGETYADTNSKVLDAAQLKISAPRLIVDVRQLRERLRPVSKRGRRPLNPAQKSAARKRRRSTLIDEDSAYGKLRKRVLNGSGMAASSRQLRKNSEARAIASPVNGGLTRTPKRGFTPRQHLLMEQYVEHVSPEVVMATMNTPEGLTTEQVLAFSNKLKLPMEKVRKKLRYIAETITGTTKSTKKTVQEGKNSPHRALETSKRSLKIKISPASVQGDPENVMVSSYHEAVPAANLRENGDEHPMGVESSSPVEPEIVVVDSP